MAYNNNYGGYGPGGGDYGNNYTTTSYGPQGGADGGGFIPGGSQDASKKNSREKESLRPLTIRQVNLAEEVHSGGEVMLDGNELTRVSLVGQIRSITKQATNHLYRLDDGTGTLEGRVWVDIDAPTHDDMGNPLADNPDTPHIGDWIRVLGVVKVLNAKKFVTVNNMKKIKDKNEINYHLLEATYVHLFLTKGPPESLQGNESSGAMQGVQSSYGNNAANGAADGLGNVSSIARKVYLKLKAEGANDGMHLDLVARELSLSYAQVKRAAEELSNESKIFTTVDDDTYAVLEE